MVRIWYSIQGDGMGHAIRSDTLIRELLKKHDLIITASSKKAYKFMKQRHGSIVHEIEGQIFRYENNEVKVSKSIIDFFIGLFPKSKTNIKKISKLLYKFKPDIVISDFEPASHYYANILNIPCISIDNVHSLTECKINFDNKYKDDLKGAKILIKILHLKSDFYIIPAFAKLKPRNPKKTFITDPIIREEVRKIKPKKGNHVLVYQTTSTNKKILETLSKNKNKFKVYGLKSKKKYKNITFKKFSEKEFLEDLRSCKYVIINGGFTVISEALHLKKPILSIPIKNQLEQEFNGYTLKKEGCGNYTNNFSIYDLENFEKNIDKYKSRISKIKRWDHKASIKILDKIIPGMLSNKPRYELLKIFLRN